MLSFRVKEILFGNWRNKGVALFFAVTIWTVAYYSETQKETIAVRLEFQPRPEGRVIIRQSLEPGAEGAPFDRKLSLGVSGPRHEIEKLKGDGRLREVAFPVDLLRDEANPKAVAFDASQFKFIPPGVVITEFVPATVYLTADELEEREFAVEPLFQGLPAGMEADAPRIDPARVMVRGPRVLLEKLRVTAEAHLRITDPDQGFEETVPLDLKLPETVDRALVESQVRFTRLPAQVKFAVRVRYQSDSFAAEGIKVRFLTPPRFPYRIQFPEETVAVKFQGPVREIRRLRERAARPDFFLAVRVPGSRDSPLREPGPRETAPREASSAETIAFTEDGLLGYGLSERVQILQHPDRRAAGKGAWTYSLVPLAGGGEPGSK